MSRATTVVLTMLALAGCDQVEKIQGGSGAGATVPDAVQDVFDRTCNNGNCHEANAGGLSLVSPASNDIIGGSSTGSPLPMVELGNVNGSYLAIKLLPEPPSGTTRTGDRMPLSGALASVDNAVILGWIAGAELPGGVAEGGDDEDTGDVNDKACSLQALSPGSPSPVVSGTIEFTIPTTIGQALERNCGCHYSSDLVRNAPYVGPTVFTTWAEFQAPYPGTNPTYAGLLTLDAVADRIAEEGGLAMPPPYCEADDGNPITASDKTLLLDWLASGAPDAPTYNGM